MSGISRRDPQKTMSMTFTMSCNYVEWEKGITYRKGLVRVLRDVWGSEHRERIDVIFGGAQNCRVSPEPQRSCSEEKLMVSKRETSIRAIRD